MNESRRMEMINQFMDSFSENIVGFNNTVFDAMQSLNAELENVQNNAQVPYNEPANFNKFTKKYKQEFFEEQYRKQAERNQEVEANTNSINNRIDAVKRSASLGVNEIVAESTRDLESMRTFRNRMQAELDDLQSELSAKKQQFSEIVHNDALSMEERHAQIEALKEPGLNARIEELSSRIATIDAFTQEVDKLASLDVENNEKIEETLFEVAQNLGEQAKTRAESKTAAEVVEEAVQEQAPEQAPEEVVQAVTNPDEPTPEEVIEDMDEEQIRRRMAELMGLSYDEFVNREIKYEVSNPGRNFIDDINPHDMEYQMDDWAVDEFNDLRNKLHEIKGKKAAAPDPVSTRIDEIRKRMGELLGIPPFEGIENENEHAIEYQMDDWAIDEFQELRDELNQLLNQQKTNESPVDSNAPVSPEATEEEALENAPAAPTGATNVAEENLVDRDFSTEGPGLNFNASKTANDNAKRIIGKRKAGMAMLAGGIALVGLAATTLYGVPVASAVLCGAAVLGGTEILDRVTSIAREKATTRNLRKFADKMGLEVVFDYSAGTVDFARAVKNGEKYEYIPVKDPKVMYAIAAEKGLTEEQTNELFRKCTRKPVTGPFAAVGRGVKDLFVENKDGMDLSVIANTGSSAYEHGLADLYSDFGGIRITDPTIEDEQIKNIIEEAHKAGKDKIETNIERLEYIKKNAQKYNLTEAQLVLINEALEKQEAIQKNFGHRIMDGFKKFPIFKKLRNDKVAGRSETKEQEQAQAQTQAQTQEQTEAQAQAQTQEQTEAQAQAQTQEQAQAQTEAQTQAQAQEQAPTAPSSTDAPANENDDDINKLFEEESLVSEDEEDREQEQAQEQAQTVPVAAPAQEISPEVIEQLRQADQATVDMMVEQWRENNVSEEAIQNALNQAGLMQEQSAGRTL